MTRWHVRSQPSRGLLPVLTVLLLLVSSARGQQYPRSDIGTSLITTIRQAHTLTRQQAARAYPVQLRGIVTFYDPYQDDGRQPALFIEDATEGMFVKLKPGPVLPIHSGSNVTVSGVTDPGGYAPIIILPTLHALETSGPLPLARRVTLPHLLTGSEDGQWVEVEAIVHSFEVYGKHVVLNLATTDGPLTATTLKEDGNDYSGLVDAKVLLRGVAAPLVNSNRQMTGVRILFPDMTAVTVEQSGSPDPFNIVISPLGSLLQYSPTSELVHRVHARGRLTLFWPGRSLCIQDGEDGLCVQTLDRSNFREGELVDVVGYPSIDNFEPALSDAIVRRTGHISVAPIRRITAQQAYTGEHQAELVQIEARLLGRSRVMTDEALLMSSGGLVFLVVLPQPSISPSGKNWPVWIDGSTLLVSGVLSGTVDTQQTTRRQGISRLESFKILARSPEDIVVVRSPSWWTGPHTLVVLGIVVILTLAVLIWVSVLRSQVEKQTLLIRRSEKRFRHQAEHDALTGLTSRSALHEHFSLALEQAQRNGMPLALLMMDVDNFKHVNDSLGHAAGDEVLCNVAGRLKASVRKSDTLVRMGGDEFLALLPGIEDIAELSRIAKEVVRNVSAPILFEGRDVPISISVGISIYPENGENAASLLRNGDMAMYRAKALGRNCYQFFTRDMEITGVDEPDIEAALARISRIRVDEKPRSAGRTATT